MHSGPGSRLEFNPLDPDTKQGLTDYSSAECFGCVPDRAYLQPCLQAGPSSPVEQKYCYCKDLNSNNCQSVP